MNCSIPGWSSRIATAAVVAGALLTGTAFAGSDFDLNGPAPNQADFRAISKDLVAAYSYKALGPAEATGITGIGIGGYATYASVSDDDAWQRLTGEDVSGLAQAGLIVQKGLPFGLDVGAFYSSIPQAGAQLVGAEVRYAILEGGIASPALAVRGSYTQALGVDDFDFSTYGLDVSISKGFAFITPYAGVGYVWGTTDPKGNAALLLDKEDVDQSRFYAGVRISALLIGITPEYERIGGRDIFNVRLGLAF